MAIVKKRTAYHLVVRLEGRQVWVSTGTDSKTRAREIERQVRVACQSRDFRFLDAEARCVTIALFRNQGWAIPTDLRAEEPLTLGKTVEMCIQAQQRSPRIGPLKTILTRFQNFVGASVPISDVWIPEIREYLQTRIDARKTESTVNKEKSAISCLFRVLAEHRITQENPARLIPSLNECGSEREVYVSHADFQRVLEALPPWLRPIAQTAYYTGMRRGEIIGLTRHGIDLSRRIIRLRADDTKERHPKRVPIHSDLIPVLESALKVQALGADSVFLRDGQVIAGDISAIWRRAATGVGLAGIRFHDLRHTWKTNARRSGMHPEIEHAIMGHVFRRKTVHERYDHISDEDFVSSIDRVKFGNGETVVWGARKRQSGAS